MAESTLTAAYNDLVGDVGFFLGYGRGTTFGDIAFTPSQQANIDRCVKGGLRNFYFCGYDWSFMRPMANLTLSQNTNVMPLPDDYGGKEGEVTLGLQAGVDWWPLPFTGVGRLYQQQALYPTTTGRPQMVCEEPIKGTTGAASSRSQLRFWPIADQAYTIQFQYYLNPDYLSGAFPYAYGGATHAECMLESCLSVAEKILDDAATVHEVEFAKRLEVSKDLDRRNKPYNLGYNRDLSDLQNRYRDRPWRSWSPIAIQGVFH